MFSCQSCQKSEEQLFQITLPGWLASGNLHQQIYIFKKKTSFKKEKFRLHDFFKSGNFFQSIEKLNITEFISGGFRLSHITTNRKNE